MRQLAKECSFDLRITILDLVECAARIEGFYRPVIGSPVEPCARGLTDAVPAQRPLPAHGSTAVTMTYPFDLVKYSSHKKARFKNQAFLISINCNLATAKQTFYLVTYITCLTALTTLSGFGRYSCISVGA
jgi:hypothetical protein